VLGYKFRFKADDTVVCTVPTAWTTTEDAQDAASYVYEELAAALRETGQLFSARVAMAPCTMKCQLRLLDLCKAEGITFQQIHADEQGVDLECCAPGFEAIARFQAAVDAEFGRGAFQCQQMPHGGANTLKPPVVDYSSERSTAKAGYVSELKTKDDVTPQSIQAADERLRKAGVIDPPIITRVPSFSKIVEGEAYLMLENNQQTGSFKTRGASNTLLKMVEQCRQRGLTVTGVVACSAGNHAQGVAKTA